MAECTPRSLAFDIMVGSGMLMLALTLCADVLWLKIRRVCLITDGFYALGCRWSAWILAIETGWVVTELGRQPWIIYGVMRTREAVTPMPTGRAVRNLHRRLHLSGNGRCASPAPPVFGDRQSCVSTTSGVTRACRFIVAISF